METAHHKAAHHKAWWIGSLLLAVIAAWFYIPCFDMQAVGFLHDDGVYTITAKALASGQGYGLPNLPGVFSQVKYPILYPFILAAAWIIQPEFPSNIPLLHAITASFAVLALGLLFLYCAKIRYYSLARAFLLTLLVGSHFHFIFYATSLMAEAPYFFFSLATIFIAESKLKPTPDRRFSFIWIGVLIVLSALTFHTRTIGLTLILAIGIFLLLKKRWKEAACYLVGSLSLTVLPWGLWVMTHAPRSVHFINYPFAYVYGGYGLQYCMNAPHDPAGFILALMEKGIQPIIDTLLYFLFPLFPYVLNTHPLLLMVAAIGLSVLLLWHGLRAVQHRQWRVSGLYTLLYLCVVALWMYPNQAARFLTMLLPWLWIYCFDAFKAMTSTRYALPRKLQSVLGLALIAVFSLWPAWQGYGLLKSMRFQHWLVPARQYATLWSDYQSVFSYLQANTDKKARVASIWDPLFYLYANRPTYTLYASALQPTQGQITLTSFQHLFQSMRHYQVQYVIAEPFLVNQEVTAPVNPVVQILRELYPTHFEAIYEAPHHGLKIYKITY